MKKKMAALAALCGVMILASACQRGVTLDTQTFALKHLSPGEAQTIVRPYVYEDRADGPHGMLSASGGVLTVRETPDNLAKIRRVLEEFDVPRPSVRLHFQLIEADHFTGTDPAIAPVEAQLKKIFQFSGYRLVGQAVVGATDNSAISQSLPRHFQISSDMRWTDPSTIRLEDLSLYSSGARLLRTTVNVHPGQTLVVGSAAERGQGTATLLLTLRAEEDTTAAK